MIACPKCGGRCRSTTDSRPTGAYGGAIRRRRECSVCGHRLTTYELPAEQLEADRPSIEPEALAFANHVLEVLGDG